MLIKHPHLRLIGPPSDFALSLLFQNGKEDTIYGKLYKNNMDGINAFYTNDKGLNYLVNGDSVALIQDGTLINSIKDYHCKVHFIAPS